MLLDRVPPGAEEDIAAHLQEMLAAHGLGGAPLFVVPETTLHDGLLPEPVVAPLRGWFSDLARDAAHRAPHREARVPELVLDALGHARGEGRELAAVE